MVVATIAIAWSGWSIWPLGVVVWALAALLIAQYTGWTMAIVGTLVSLLTVEILLLRVLPWTGIDLALSHIVFWGAFGVVLAFLVGRRRPRVIVPSRAALRLAMAILAAPVVGGLAVLIAAVVVGFARISWAMNNDAVWTTMVARHIGQDDGIDTVIHPNSSPMMSALMAVGEAPGRAVLPGVDLLGSDVGRDAQLWMLVILATSLIAGVIVARATGSERPTVRFVGIVVVGCVPFSWFVSGFAVDYGFYSASLATLLLLCAWALWQSARRQPIWAFVFLLLLATDLLATWAPLVVVPLGLAALVFFRGVDAFFDRGRPVAIGSWAIAVAQLVLYIVAVAIPDFESGSGALSAGGAIQRFPVSILIALALLALLLGGLLRHRRLERTLGLAVLCACVAVGLVVLLAEAKWQWTYYPVKFTWLSATLLLVVAGALAVRLVQVVKVVWLASASGVAAVVAFGVIAIQAPPTVRTIASISPFIQTMSGSGHNDILAARLFAFSDPGRKTLLSRYSPSTSEDEYVNFWLLQSTAQLDKEPIRNFSYSLDPSNAQQVCSAITTWGGGVVVETRDPTWGSQLRAACPDARFSVRLHSSSG